MFFQDVSPGDPRLPESAERYNAVNRLLNSCGDHHSFAGEGSFNGNIIIDFCNISDREILPFTPVSLYGAMDKESLTMLRERFSGGSYTAVRPAENGSTLWGISLDKVPPSESGRAVISGVVPAWFTGSGNFVTPELAGLIAGDSGAGQVIAHPVNYSGTVKDDSFPGIILLGGNSADSERYDGTFKLLPVSATQLKLISGSVPEQTDFAGGSDVPGFSKIPQMMLELAPDIRHWIYIYFDYDKAGKEYSVHLGTEIPDGIVLYEYLGEFFNGSVVQSYKKNSYLRFGDIWYLTPEGE